MRESISVDTVCEFVQVRYSHFLALFVVLPGAMGGGSYLHGLHDYHHRGVIIPLSLSFISGCFNLPANHFTRRVSSVH